MHSYGQGDHLQDRLNRMHAWKDQQRRIDEDFIRKQKIRMFINDCDEIRPTLRNQLLKDSKLCQLEQMKDQHMRQQMKIDVECAWHEIQSRDNQVRVEREKFVSEGRWREGLSIQSFLKQQMEDKREQSFKVYDEINSERKQIAEMRKEDYEKEQVERMEAMDKRKTIGEAVSRQMRDNYETKKKQLENELKRDQLINERIRQDLLRAEKADRDDREQFKRDVFTYLDHLMSTRRHNSQIEREKEKLIDDIRAKALEDEWQKRCETRQKRVLVNQIARVGQVDQIRWQEKKMIEEASKEKHENAEFNAREMMERQRQKEAQWQQRLKAYHYGRELMDQRKSEELRDMAAKQKLNEDLMLAESERQKCETMGHEFVKSCQDVLPLHPNLVIIQRGKHN